MKVGLALSGGGIRSAAQLGVVQALREKGINFEVFAGTSGGSVIATLLALGYTPEQGLKLYKETHDIIDIAFLHILKGLFTSSTIEGFCKGARLEKSLDKIFDSAIIQDVKHPLAIVTTDIQRGRQVIFSNATDFDIGQINDDSITWNAEFDSKLSEVVRASCGLPGVFIPKFYKWHTLVDGGLVNNLPSDAAKALKADRVISIDLGKNADSYKSGSIYSTIVQSYSIIYDRSEDNNRNSHDIYLNPKVNDIPVLDTNRIEEGFERGYSYGKLVASHVIDALANDEKLKI